MSKETIKHFNMGLSPDEAPPVCGAFGESVGLIDKTTCERCLKILADWGRKAVEQAYILDYFEVKK